MHGMQRTVILDVYIFLCIALKINKLIIVTSVFGPLTMKWEIRDKKKDRFSVLVLVLVLVFQC